MTSVVQVKGPLDYLFKAPGVYRAEFETDYNIYKVWAEDCGWRIEVWKKVKDRIILPDFNTHHVLLEKDVIRYIPPNIQGNIDWLLFGYFPY